MYGGTFNCEARSIIKNTPVERKSADNRFSVFLIRYFEHAPVALIIAWLLFGACAGKAMAQAGSVQFSAPVFDVSEPAAGSLIQTISVTRTEGHVGAVSVRYSVYASGKGDTAQGKVYTSASVSTNKDFTPSPVELNVAAEGGLTWADGDSATKTITITINSDTEVEGDEWLSAVLVRPDGGATIGTQQTARVRILDADSPVAGVLQMTSMNYFVKETAGTVTVAVRRSGGNLGAVSVNYSTSANAPAGLLGGPAGSVSAYLAASVSDFTSVSGTLTWADGETTDKHIVIPIIDDDLLEGAEAFTVNLSSATGGAAVGSPASAPVFISDNETSVVNIKNSQDGSDRRLWFPADVTALKGIYAFLPGSGSDTRFDVENQSWQAMLQTWGFCIFGQRGNTFGRSVANILDVAALAGAFTGHPELANAPFVLTGFSYGAFESANGAEMLPERALCFVGFNWGKTASTSLTALQKSVPGVFLPGSEDSLSPYTFRMFFESYRNQGSPVAIAANWKIQHLVNNLGTGPLFTWHYISEIIRLRYPAGAAPGINPGETVPLQNIATDSGWLGDPLETDPVTGKISYASPFVYVNDYTNYLSPRGFVNDKASWLPSKASAMSYRAQVSAMRTTYSPLVDEPYQTPLKFTAPSGFQRFIEGQDVEVTIDPRSFSTYYGTIAKMDLFDQGVKVGERTTPPWTWTIPAPSKGAHGLTVTALSGTGTNVAGLTLYTVSNEVLPTPVVALSATPSSGSTIDLYWSDTSYCEDGFRIERKEGAAGTYVPLVTLPANTGTFTDSGLTPGIPYSYRVTAYNSAGDAAAATATADTAVALSGPVAIWTCDENTGLTAYDSSGNTNNGTLQGDAVFSSDGKPPGGYSIEFNGTSSLVRCGSGASLRVTNAITIMGWFKHRSTGGDGTVGIDKVGCYRLTVQENNAASSKFQFYLVDATGAQLQVTTPVAFSNDVWHHVCGTFNGNELRIYVDGVLQASLPQTGTIKTTGSALEIGRRDGIRFYRGKIDHVKIYGRALGTDEVLSEYATSKNMTFESWLAGNFPLADRSDPLIVAAGADPDKDGIVNFLEYAFVRNPNMADPRDLLYFFTETDPLDGLKYFNISYTRLPSPADITYINEDSINLVDWTNDPGHWKWLSTTNNGTAETVQWRLKPAMSLDARKFVRVRIARP